MSNLISKISFLVFPRPIPILRLTTSTRKRFFLPLTNPNMSTTATLPSVSLYPRHTHTINNTPVYIYKLLLVVRFILLTLLIVAMNMEQGSK